MHSAIRRYLVERQGVLADEHRPSERPLGQLPPDEARRALAGWGAFLAAQGLLCEVERTTPSGFATVEALRAFVREMVQGKPNSPHLANADEVRLDAANEERQRLIEYVDGLSDTAAEL